VDKRGFLFFDLDGTIANSGPGITASMNDAFASAGLAELTEVEVRRIIGPPLQTTMPELLQARQVELHRVDEFIDLYRAIYREHHLPCTPLIDGMGDILEELSHTWHLSVVTAKPQAQAEIAVRAVGVDHYMVTIVGPADDAPMPKARLLERAFHNVENALGVTPTKEASWMIGDRHHDIDAAREVGTHAMGVLWGYGDHDELHSAGAHAVVSTPRDILDVVTAHADRR
jgi:phosphoglycolate phosphatase